MSNVNININNLDNSVNKTLQEWADLCKSIKKVTLDDYNNIVINIPSNILLHLPKTKDIDGISMTYTIKYDWVTNNKFLRRKKIEKIFNI